MRRMITETDVEKLDAMQDPKEAQENFVLTADGKGKAVYKTISDRTNLYISEQKFEEQWLSFSSVYDDISPMPGFTYNWLYADVYGLQEETIDFQVLWIAGQNQTDLINTLITKGIITIHYPGFVRIFISPEIASELGITEGSSANTRYTYREIALWAF